MSIQPFRIDIPQADLDDLCTGPNSTAEVTRRHGTARAADR